MTELDEPIRLAPYDSSWPDRFAGERAALEGPIGPWATGGIHHVGSTAVPGLEAKPIIDILVGVDSLEASRACFDPLAELDYLYAPYRDDEMHWFCKPHPSRRTHHLHLVPTRLAAIPRRAGIPRQAASLSRDGRGVRGAEARPGGAISRRPRGLHRRQGRLPPARARCWASI